MICPHCSADLRRKQRYKSRCSKCRKTFALEPKENDLHLHDLKVRRLAAMLADPPRPGAAPLRYTADQLRLAASRKALIDGPRSGWASGSIAVAVIGGFSAFFAGASDNAELVGPVFVGTVVLLAFCLVGHLATERERRLSGEPMDATRFNWLLRRWAEVYGEQPPGLLPQERATDVWPSAPPVALLCCTDAGTLRFLAASGIVERRQVALIHPGREWPPPALLSALRAHPALPVLVLHHADAAGCLEVPRIRAVLPPGTRVIDAGLRPRVAKRAGPPVRLRPDSSLLDELTRTGAVDDDELSWLAEGNAYPLAAVRPARLYMAVERALNRIDPEEERAAAMGFLAWPERVG